MLSSQFVPISSFLLDLSDYTIAMPNVCDANENEESRRQHPNAIPAKSKSLHFRDFRFAATDLKRCLSTSNCLPIDSSPVLRERISFLTCFTADLRFAVGTSDYQT
jgi:hypothetical protein